MEAGIGFEPHPQPVGAAGAAGHCPTLGPKVGFADPPYVSSPLREPDLHEAALHELVDGRGSAWSTTQGYVASGEKQDSGMRRVSRR
jgi:hypothetical protein